MRLRALAATTFVAVVLLTTSTTPDTLAAQTVPAASVTSPSVAAPAAPVGTPIALPSVSPKPPTGGATGTASGAGTTGSATARSSSVSDGDPVPPGTPPAAAPAPPVVSAAAVVVAFARSHLRARYRHDATGPSSFDCSGLMWRVFREAGLSGKVSTTSARGIYLSYRARGLTSRKNPQIGDLIVWGHGSHVGVYIGKGLAISALVSGVRVHRVRAMFTPFTAYLHTHLSGIEKPAWELQLAKHIRSLRHATRAVFLHEGATGTSPTSGMLRSGTRFVVLARRHDGRGRLWLKALTFTGKTGWVRATASAR